MCSYGFTLSSRSGRKLKSDVSWKEDTRGREATLQQRYFRVEKAETVLKSLLTFN